MQGIARHTGRWGLLSLALVLVTAVLIAASAAMGISAPIHIANTGGEGVFIRPEPNTSRPAIGWMPEGASPDYHCFAWGQNINGVPIWFNVTYNGKIGYYASYYDDSSYHSNEELTAKYGVPLCGSAPPSPAPVPSPAPSPKPAPVPSSPPAPSSGTGSLVFTVFNAAGGVYFRNSPNWDDARRIAGAGVYEGDRVQVKCGASGGVVGPYANSWWSYVTNLTRPSAGSGWVNAHFIDDGMPANTPSPGEPSCGPDTPGAAAPPAAGESPAAPESVFFSPNGNPNGLGTHAIATYPLRESEWKSSTKCSPRAAVAGVSEFGPDVHTLAGWSRGRLGAMYALTSPKLRAQIHRIILFDPGSSSDFKDSCETDSALNINALLAAWVGRGSDNQLLVLTGEDSEEPSGGDHSRYTYSGLWHWYFAGLWNQPYAERALVCDYHGASHEGILGSFSSVIKSPPSDKCPYVPWYAPATAWHP